MKKNTFLVVLLNLMFIFTIISKADLIDSVKNSNIPIENSIQTLNDSYRYLKDGNWSVSNQFVTFKSNITLNEKKLILEQKSLFDSEKNILAATAIHLINPLKRVEIAFIYKENKWFYVVLNNGEETVIEDEKETLEKVKKLYHSLIFTSDRLGEYLENVSEFTLPYYENLPLTYIKYRLKDSSWQMKYFDKLTLLDELEIEGEKYNFEFSINVEKYLKYNGMNIFEITLYNDSKKIVYDNLIGKWTKKLTIDKKQIEQNLKDNEIELFWQYIFQENPESEKSFKDEFFTKEIKKETKVEKKTEPEPKIKSEIKSEKKVEAKSELNFYNVINVSKNKILKVRENADIESNIVGEIPFNGSKILVDNCSEQWCKIRFNYKDESQNYISKEYLEKSEPLNELKQINRYKNKIYKVAEHDEDEFLNVRSGRDISYKVIDTLAFDKDGIKIIFCYRMKNDSKWCWINYDNDDGKDAQGWVNDNYLKAYK